MARPLILALLLVIAWPIAAQEGRRDDPDRPSLRIAADLGLTEDALVHCVETLRPQLRFSPIRAHKEANKAVLLPCLTDANPALTPELLESVMKSYGPKDFLHLG